MSVQRALRRALRGLKKERRLSFFHQVDDPYSHLLAQCLPRLLAAFPDLALEVYVVPVPSADVDPAPRLRRAYAVRDASRVATLCGLTFPEVCDQNLEPIPEDRLRRVHAVLLKTRAAREQLDAAIALGNALWMADADRLSRLVKELGAIPGQHVRPRLEAAYGQLRRAGHYQGAMLEYNGEWYWGMDRLDSLAEQLVHDGLGDLPSPAFRVRLPWSWGRRRDGLLFQLSEPSELPGFEASS